MARPHILLVHGAWHGAWCWDDVRAILEADGWQTTAIDLPSVHRPAKVSVAMRDDADAVRDAVDAIAGEVLVVAHSYGGIPVTEGADHPAVRHIMFVAAFVLDVGESLLSSVGGVEPAAWRKHDGLVDIGTPDHPAEKLFFGDLPAEQATAATARLRSMSYRAKVDPVTRAAWKSRPTTYVVTDHDGIFPPAKQQAFAERAGARIVHAATSHSPFLSEPKLLAALIAEVGLAAAEPRLRM